MAQLITGRFEDIEQVKRAIAAAAEAGFERRDYGVFYVTPPGQHGSYPIGGRRLCTAHPGLNLRVH